MARTKWLVTEKDWLTAKTVLDLDLYLASKSHRKWRLFGSACAERALVFLPHEKCFRSAIACAEEFADGRLTWDDVKQVRKEVKPVHKKLQKVPTSGPYHAADAVLRALDKVPLNALHTDRQAAYAFAEASRPRWDAGYKKEERQQVALAHDIFGNPFRPVIVNSTWLTTTVKRLAQAIYTDRAFDRLPVLADALEEAGCTNAGVLGHCRGPGPHVRGCWVVDLLLGKE